MPAEVDLDGVIETIIKRRTNLSQARALLVGLSGIDASGKGYLTKQIVSRLWQRSVHAVSINVDGWLNLPEVRFNQQHPAINFYQCAIRFEDMLEQLVLPLRESRHHRLIADHATETGTQFEKHLYEFNDVDVILLEGIFLFKKEYAELFDLKIWIDCSFETALSRALARQQEGLPPAETIHAYKTIYFPAQRLHFRQDHPRRQADLIVKNDRNLFKSHQYRLAHSLA